MMTKYVAVPETYRVPVFNGSAATTFDERTRCVHAVAISETGVPETMTACGRSYAERNLDPGFDWDKPMFVVRCYYCAEMSGYHTLSTFRKGEQGRRFEWPSERCGSRVPVAQASPVAMNGARVADVERGESCHAPDALKAIDA